MKINLHFLWVVILCLGFAAALKGQEEYEKNIILKIFDESLSQSEFKSIMFHSIVHENSVIQLNSEHPTAFFCRLENHLDKKLKIPIRFRLGSYEYASYLEGK